MDEAGSRLFKRIPAHLKQRGTGPCEPCGGCSPEPLMRRAGNRRCNTVAPLVTELCDWCERLECECCRCGAPANTAAAAEGGPWKPCAVAATRAGNAAPPWSQVWCVPPTHIPLEVRLLCNDMLMSRGDAGARGDGWNCGPPAAATVLLGAVRDASEEACGDMPA